MDRLALSCCYIIKNEADFLETSLNSVAPFVDELIICDSGSTDGSREIAEKFKDKVPQFKFFERPWTDHFADARNAAAKQAQHDWILFVDGDEFLDPESWPVIQRLVERPEGKCYSLIQRNYVVSPTVETSKPLSGAIPKELQSYQMPLFYFDNLMERLYRKDLGLGYTGRIHESLIPTAQKLGIKCEATDVVLHHLGRLKKPGDKYLYYLELSRTKLKEDPTNPAAWIEICVNLMELSQMKEAFEVATIAAKQFSSEPEILRVAFQAALRNDSFAEAEYYIRKYLSFYPNDLFAKSQLTTAMLYQGKFPEVLNLASEILKVDPENFVAHVNCAVIFFEKQDWKSAARHIGEGLKSRPDDQFLIDAMSKIPTEFQIH